MKFSAAVLVTAFLFGNVMAGQAQTATKAGSLRVGAAKVDMTPSENELPKQYLGVLDHVYSRAIVIDNGTTTAALVTVDVLFLPDPMAKRVLSRISSELGISEKNVVLAGTSTHSVPMGRGVQGPPFPTEMGKIYDDKIVESVKLAKSKLQPATMSYGTGVSYINVQRDYMDPKLHHWWEGPNYDGTSDKTVAVVTFRSLNGEPIALYYNYSVFNVITGTLDLVSGDIAGATSRYLEDNFDDKVVALFSIGAHGDQNPIYFQQTYDLREIRIRDYAKQGKDISNAMPPPGGTGMDRSNPQVVKLMNQQKQMILSMGQMLGEEVRHVMRTSGPEESKIQIYSDEKTITCPGRQRLNEGRGGVAGTYKDADPVAIRLGVLMLGDVAIGEVSGNPYTEIGLRFKRESPYKKTILAARVNGGGPYIPDDASYGHQTFAVLNSAIKPGCAESAIVEGIIDLMPKIAY